MVNILVFVIDSSSGQDAICFELQTTRTACVQRLSVERLELTEHNGTLAETLTDCSVNE